LVAAFLFFMEGIMNKKIQEGCIINEYFCNSNDPEFYRKKYCNENCNYKCIRGLEYQKIKKEK